MPYVNIQLTDEGMSREKKAELIKATSNMLETIMNKPASTTFVVIEEVPEESWGVGGVSVAEIKRQK